MLTRKQQQQRKQKQMREQAELAKLAKQVGRLPDGSLPKDKKKKDDGSSLLVNYRSSDVAHYPSAPSISVTEEGIFLEEGHDWAAREQAAQEEIERKKKRTAPLYNKGGYQYISDDTDLTTVGRKI
jgi:hypothetical protein